MPGNSEMIQERIQADRTGLIEVIIKYNGDILKVGEELNIDIEILNSNYAIATLEVSKLDSLYNYREVEYIELPKDLSFALSESLNKACITSVQNDPNLKLSGKGTIVGIIDSGIDYTHPDFINPDGTSRILYIWDQSSGTNPPAGFKNGTEYTSEQLNEALKNSQPLSVIPQLDTAGHGTAVSGIAAGNGRASNGREKGAAPEASLIVVKLGQTGNKNFARSTEIMRAIKYISDKAIALNMPVSMNLSYGTNNGSHDGNSLFETYINSMAQMWKTVICVASGNEGSAGHHYFGQIDQDETLTVEFVTSGNPKGFYLTLWKNFVDALTFELIAPGGRSTGVIRPDISTTKVTLDRVPITAIYGQPTHYSESQEVLFLFGDENTTIPQGLWKLVVKGEQVTDGRFDIWLPTLEDVTSGTAFSQPSAETTLTLPSTAQTVITVGGYNSAIGSSADFSGRGYTRTDIYIKPDLVAPAVNILTTRAGGGYDTFTGTSMAAPFVTGAAALMMEWGIVKKNDPFLYGQRVKAFLQKGAERSFSITYPNPVWGYGTLCLKNTMELLVEYGGT